MLEKGQHQIKVRKFLQCSKGLLQIQFCSNTIPHFLLWYNNVSGKTKGNCLVKTCHFVKYLLKTKNFIRVIPKFQEPYVDRVIFFQRNIFQRPHDPRVFCTKDLCSQGPMFQESYLPKALWSPSPRFQGSYICRMMCFKGPMFLGFYVSKALCFKGPMF